MFTPSLNHLKYHEIHHQELVREAQRYRLLREALKSRPSQVPQYAKFLAAFGRKLISLGSSLEARYDPSAHIKMLKQGISHGC